MRSFNYGSSGNSQTNSVGVEGTRQLANLNYGICVRMAPNQCSISWSRVQSDSFSFTLTGDVGAVDPTLIGTSALQMQTCTTDFIVIPSPSQGNTVLSSDRFCGLGFATTTSKYTFYTASLIIPFNLLTVGFVVGNMKPFVLYVHTDGDEAMDIANRGFALSYSQSLCPVL